MKVSLIFRINVLSALIAVQNAENISLQKAFLGISQHLSQQPYKVTLITDRNLQAYRSVIRATSEVEMATEIQTLENFKKG